MRSFLALLAGGAAALVVPVVAEVVAHAGGNPFEINNGEPGRETAPVAIQ